MSVRTPYILYAIAVQWYIQHWQICVRENNETKKKNVLESSLGDSLHFIMVLPLLRISAAPTTGFQHVATLTEGYYYDNKETFQLSLRQHMVHGRYATIRSFATSNRSPYTRQHWTAVDRGFRKRTMMVSERCDDRQALKLTDQDRAWCCCALQVLCMNRLFGPVWVRTV